MNDLGFETVFQGPAHDFEAMFVQRSVYVLCIVSKQDLNCEEVTKQKNCAKHNSTIKPRDIQVVVRRRIAHHANKTAKFTFEICMFLFTGSSIWTNLVQNDPSGDTTSTVQIWSGTCGLCAIPALVGPVEALAGL